MYPRNQGRASRNALHRFLQHHTVDQIPPQLPRATITRAGNRIWLTGYARQQPSSTRPKPFDVWTIATSLSSTERWAVENILMTDNGEAIAQALQEGTCVAVSDGSFKNSHGTAAWVLEGPTAEGRITCPLTTPGRPEVQSAYRSEAAGLYGIATAVKIICQVFAIRKGECVIACDGEAALKECTDKDPNIFIKAAQYDLVIATQAQLQACPISWKPMDVMGHRDEFFGPLTQLEAVVC